MSLILIFQIIFSLSLLVVLFIFLRNLPFLVEFEPRSLSKEEKLTFRLRRKISSAGGRISEAVHKVREKMVHRLKVSTLKIDNFLTSYLKKTREIRLQKKKNGDKSAEKSKAATESKR
ncbi:MAG: hypothetical protein V1841_00235 [Patescibacteria group bacterium]